MGSIRTGFTDVCTKEIVQTLRTLWVPPSGLPLMIIGERDATVRTFELPYPSLLVILIDTTVDTLWVTSSGEPLMIISLRDAAVPVAKLLFLALF